MTSLVIEGCWALFTDGANIAEKGLWSWAPRGKRDGVAAPPRPATRTFGGGDVENGPRSRRYGFDYKACISVVNSAAGGLTVAAVLKFADAVLKGYATAISVILTGLFSMLFFGTTLSVEYALGMVNVFAAIVLYNVRNLDANAW